jgi:drug/metabolite transporter (DMT)-like permease
MVSILLCQTYLINNNDQHQQMVNPNDNNNNPTADQLVVGTLKHFFTVGSISLFGTCANYLLNEAVIHGKAGPSQALVESQSLWMLFLEVFFLHEMPN